MDDGGVIRPWFATLPRMSIEMRAAEVYRLAETLRGAGDEAELVGLRLRGTPQVDGGLQPAIEHFLESHRAAGRAFAGELAWLAGTVTDVANSWLRLDGTLLSSPGGATAE